MKNKFTQRSSILMQNLFSIMVWILSFCYMAIISILFGIYRLAPSHQFRLILQRLMSYNIYLTMSRVKVVYHPHFNPERVSVFCQNHISMLDSFVALTALPHTPICGVMHGWQFKIPIYGWIMKLGHGIPIKRNGLQLLYIQEKMKQRAAQGLSVLVFPEGSRTRDGNVHPFSPGILRCAKAAGLPVVPIAVDGLFSVNRAKSRLFKPGNITIFVGQQIETNHYSNAQLNELAKLLEQTIREKLNLFS